MARKNYTPREKEAYHTNRVNNPHVSDEKKLYSQKWIDGFHDKHAEFNFRSVSYEIKCLKKDKNTPRDHKIMLNAYKNGLKTNLDSQKRK